MMGKPHQNYGIQVSGSGQLHASQVAVGPGARAVGGDTIHGAAAAVPRDLDELRQALAEIVDRLRADAPGVDDAPALAAVAEAAHREARKPRPSKAVLAGLLDALLAGVAKVATLAGAVEAIQHAVGALL
jgi:hypothetical protein